MSTAPTLDGSVEGSGATFACRLVGLDKSALARLESCAAALDVPAESVWRALFVAFLYRYTGDETIRLNHGGRCIVFHRCAELPFASLARAAEALVEEGEAPYWIGQGQPPGGTAIGLEAADAAHDPRLWLDGAKLLDYPIDGLLASLRMLTASACEDPSRAVVDLEMLGESDRKLLCEQWNDTAEYAVERLEVLLARQVRERPNAAAIVSARASRSYRELDERSDDVAARLLAALAPGAIVATLIDDGIAKIECLFGILKSGSAFVCLDECHPSERLAEILEETRPAVLLVDGAVARHEPVAAAAAALGVAILGLEATAPALRAGAGDAVARQVARPVDDVAYIVYTSGSTGRPKGIVQTHRSFAQFIDWQAREIGIGPAERVIQWASIGYDASYCEIFGTLCYGGTLCIEDAEVRFNASRLADWVERVGATILQTVPSFCRQLVDVLPASGALPKLKCLMLAGEALPTDLVLRIREQLDVRIYNLYGPSESVLATFEAVPDVPEERSFVSIGRAIDGRQMLILDGRGRLCPVGAPGEIHIRSGYLTSGYFLRPEESAARFIQNPLHAGFHDPVFRTGDIGRFLPDGRIEFLGRADRLVKLRGMRVELGEIEAVLRTHPLIEDCVCLVHTLERGRDRLTAKDRAAREAVASGSQFLVAYLACGGREPSVADLRGRLAARLPAHMIPQQFIVLDALPYNANHKLDVSALPRPENVRPELGVPFVAPRTETERLLAGIWTDVLGVDKVGIEDGFYDLGGDSLLAMQIMNRAALRGLALRQRIILQNGTIDELARAACDPAAEATRRPVREAAAREHYPLTHAQWGLWYLWKVDPGNPFYTAQGSIHLHGELAVGRWLDAWRTLVERHEALRTRFASVGGEPVQTFTDYRAADVEVVDLSGRGEPAARAEMDRLNTENGRYAFDLENDQLLRPILFRLSERHHEFVVTYQEIIFDLWGYAVMIRDLARLYETRRPLEEAELDLGDFAVWESRHIVRERLAAEEAYWCRELAGELPIINLPLDRPRRPKPDFAGGGESAIVDAVLTANLKKLARRHRVSLFTLLLTAFHVSLRRYARQDDIIIGAPIANRHARATEEIVGWFLNMLPIRIVTEGDPTFADLLAYVHEKTTSALSNADYPFRWMMESANVTRDASTAPVFQVMFNWQNLPQQSLKTDGLDISSSEVDSTYKKYDLALYAQEHLDRIYVQYSYLSELFDRETIRRMLTNFLILLEGVSDLPDAPISRLPHMAPAEREELLLHLNGPRTDIDTSADLCDLFRAQVKATPDATALIFGDETRTYRQLEMRASALAGKLADAGVGRGDVVALCVERGFDTVAAVLGVAALRAAHVAVDPSYPHIRRQAILADTRCVAYLHDRGFPPPAQFQGAAVAIDDVPQASAWPSTATARAADPEEIYNIVYTSASTGEAKGVAICHRALRNRLEWMWAAYPWQPGDVAVLHKSYSIVAASWEIWGALLKGRPTLILGRDDVRDPGRFWDACVRNGVTHLLSSPALIRNVLGYAANAAAPWRTLRFATTSAEPIPRELVEQWSAAFPGVPLLNLYGSTECASNVTVYDATHDQRAFDRVLLGKPLPNTSVYVVDREFNLVPRGAVGEMCVAGACVAKGYHGNVELTREKFVANPFPGHGAVLYRTGDLVRIDNDFNLDLQGREDSQVNVRGYRVELADVEACLASHPAVERCAAAAIEQGGLNALCAYYQTRDDELNVMDLRKYLRERLPDFMVPQQLIEVAAIPLTANGKVDRKALPKASPAAAAKRSGEPLQTETEHAIAEIWKELLKVDAVYRRDRFFDLGGHSLLAVDAANEIARRLGTAVEFRTLVFEDLERVAASCEAATGSSGKSFFGRWRQ